MVEMSGHDPRFLAKPYSHGFFTCLSSFFFGLKITSIHLSRSRTARTRHSGGTALLSFVLARRHAVDWRRAISKLSLHLTTYSNSGFFRWCSRLSRESVFCLRRYSFGRIFKEPSDQLLHASLLSTSSRYVFIPISKNFSSVGISSGFRGTPFDCQRPDFL